MIETRPPRIVPLRYSPKPITAYSLVLPGGVNAGPAFAEFLKNDAEAWNLAFLSHPYEKRAEHPDPNFTIYVRRTLNVVLSTGSVDVLGKLPAKMLVRGLLQLPAHEFVDQVSSLQTIANGPLLGHLPLFKAYGQHWLHTAAARAELCLRAPVASEHQPGDDVPHVADAAAVLKKFK